MWNLKKSNSICNQSIKEFKYMINELKNENENLKKNNVALDEDIKK